MVFRSWVLATLIRLISCNVGVNEVADKGTSGQCGGADWVELVNTGAAAVDLTGYKLCDDAGCADTKAYTFPGGSTIAAGEYKVMCSGATNSFMFGIGGRDLVTLQDASGNQLDTSGTLPGNGTLDTVWAKDGNGAWGSSTQPTPGAANLGVVPFVSTTTTSTSTTSDMYDYSSDVDGCNRLKKEQGFDCKACVPEGIPQETACPASSATEDFNTESARLFAGRSPSKVWNSSSILFATDEVRTIELNFEGKEANWEFLVGNPDAEEYAACDVKIPDLGEWANVGLRFKGFFGSLRSCLPKEAGCGKLPMKMQFNFANKSQRILGLKRLFLHSSTNDRTFMKERLAYGLWREMGIPAPRQNYVNVMLKVGGKTHLMGLYILTEVVDGRFTDTYFRGGDGNLWKEAWPTMIHEKDYWREAAVTNSQTANHTHVQNFAAAVKQSKTDWELANVVRQYTAAKHWAKYWAVDRAIVHWDGPMNFRDLGGRSSWTHNFFLYEDDDRDVSDREFRIIPWDTDHTFTFPWLDWDKPICSGTECVSCDKPLDGISNDKAYYPQCYKLIRAFARGLRSYYMNASTELLKGPFQLCRLQAKIDRWQQVLAPLVKRDKENWLWPTKRFEEGDFDADVKKLRNETVAKHRTQFEKSVKCENQYSAEWQPVAQMKDIPVIKGPSEVMISEWLGVTKWPSWHPIYNMTEEEKATKPENAGGGEGGKEVDWAPCWMKCPAITNAEKVGMAGFWNMDVLCGDPPMECMAQTTECMDAITAAAGQQGTVWMVSMCKGVGECPGRETPDCSAKGSEKTTATPTQAPAATTIASTPNPSVDGTDAIIGRPLVVAAVLSAVILIHL